MSDLPTLFVKAHNPGYVKKDGTYVAPFEDKRLAKKPEAPKPQGWHPKRDHKGKAVAIKVLSKATPLAAFDDPSAIATVLPDGKVPESLNGVAFAPWVDHPRTLHEWADVDGQDIEHEAPLDVPKGMNLGAGVVVREDDGRIWIVHPTNAFGGYRGSYPKGTVEDGLPLQASAIKEAYEESGLKVELIRPLMDVVRTTSVARYYLARRVGGCPSDVGWESQAVSLVPPEKLYSVLNRETDHGLAELLGAGPKPPKPQIPKPAPSGKSSGGNWWDPPPGYKPSGK